jgi:alkylhydroperoxidase/carboxymuconolactone decarboxylase family protein YurZ
MPLTEVAGVSIAAARAAAIAVLDGVPEGEPLDDATAALIDLGVRIVATTLDLEGSRLAVARALDAGASEDEVHEVLVLVSAIGVHTLMAGSSVVLDVLRARGSATASAPLNEEQAQLWAQRVGDRAFWAELDAENPGFLDALLRLSPRGFTAYFDYCAVPWATGALSPVCKELISLATDATATHRFLPGVRLHTAGALHYGAGARQVRAALDIAAAAPPHLGVSAVSNRAEPAG